MIGSTFKRTVVTTVVVTMLSQVIAPLGAYALTGGPTQPEFSKFEPVGTTDMVNPFTGDFTYNLPVLNIPGPNGSGYALSLSYHSGESSDDESSWVGKGWTLNPGAIGRNRRGFPDDYNGRTIHHYNKTEPNWTVSAGPSLNVEAFSLDLGAGTSFSANYNNYRGYTHTTAVGLDVMGMLDLGYSTTNGEGSWSVAVNPSVILGSIHAMANGPGSDDASTEGESGASGDVIRNLVLKRVRSNFDQTAHYAVGMFGEHVMPSYFPKYIGASYQFTVGANTDSWLPIGLKAGFNASYTYQENQDEDVPAYGYMYSANAPVNGAMDYYVEKDGTFNKRDRFLGIPFSNADQFVVSGEGIGGSFRLYNRNVGEFRPALKQSNTITTQAGVDLHIIGAAGIGSTVNLSEHMLNIGPWTGLGAGNGYAFARADKGDDSAFFRFTSDIGGSVLAGNDMPERAEPGHHFYTIDADIAKHINNGRRSGRSSYIGYSTIADMRDRPLAECYSTPGPSFMKSYNKADSSRRFVDYGDQTINEGIGEFAITTPNGQHYVYGLPVYSRNEKDLNFVVNGARSSDNYLVYKARTVDDGGYLVGEERSSPYATTHLLTEITTADYVDRTNDGPSADDLGGYTKFNYARVAGTNQKAGAESSSWYKWRLPYRGLRYQRNSLSDGRDDLGTVAYGEKELYYLSTIETRTHTARFITSPRADAYEADRNEANATSNPASTGIDPGNNKQQKLDRIELYAKNPDGSIGKKLSVVHMDYGYDLCHGLPNAESGNGHLTLKRVYFEYEGVVNARTSPYIFGYEYKKATDYSALSSSLQTKYASIISHGSGLTSAMQNPDYSPFSLDPWGSYRYDGETRAQNFEPWVQQKNDPAFDPAAWELKWIQLPSGGEIHIQYEQKEYRHVQNRPVMAMVNLKSTTSDDNKGDREWIHLDVDKFGITTSAEVAALAQTINNMAASDERFYFKFLYALSGEQANLVNCSSEYITGYIKIVKAEATGTDLKIQLLPPNSSPDPASGHQHPRDVAWNFVATNRAGIIGHGSCDPRVEPVHHDEEGAWGKVSELIGRFTERFFDPDGSCTRINLEHSYLRIPLNRTKKGGGVRVRRLLTYDKGIENGAAALFGTEYGYTLDDGVTSSGVATNEPASAREENPLITYIQKRDEQGWANRALSGEDKDQFESPFGESILPSPSVGYSRVVTKGIHSGKTATGYNVDEFYTAYDYPFDKVYAADGLNKASATATDLKADDHPVIFTNGLATVRHYQMARTQGYRFVLNNMHGQTKRVAQYGGDPNDPINITSSNPLGGAENDLLISEQSYTYFEPGDMVPMVHELGKDPVMEYPGKEVEVVMEKRRVDDFTVSGGVAGDLTLVFAFIPVLIPSAFPTVDLSQETLQTHVTTKVIRYPAIVKSTRMFRDGVQHVSQNIGFDPASGRPILTKTTDGYDKMLLGGSTVPQNGAYYSAVVPAWQPYSVMGQLAERERLVIKADEGLEIQKRYRTHHTLNFLFKEQGAAGRSVNLLTPGDLVRVLGPGNEYLGTFHVGAIAGNQILLVQTYISNVTTTDLDDVGSIEVLRSARTNQTSADVGSVSTYGSIPTVTEHPIP